MHGVAFRLENVSVECETVRGSRIWASGKLSTESINWIHLIGVVVLNNSKDSLDCSRVLINEILRVHEMKRLRIVNWTVGKSKVNGHVNTNFASSKDVVQESNPGVARELFDKNLIL